VLSEVDKPHIWRYVYAFYLTLDIFIDFGATLEALQNLLET
jgi:hypothetical protein